MAGAGLMKRLFASQHHSQKRCLRQQCFGGKGVVAIKSKKSFDEKNVEKNLLLFFAGVSMIYCIRVCVVLEYG